MTTQQVKPGEQTEVKVVSVPNDNETKQDKNKVVVIDTTNTQESYIQPNCFCVEVGRDIRRRFKKEVQIDVRIHRYISQTGKKKPLESIPTFAMVYDDSEIYKIPKDVSKNEKNKGKVKLELKELDNDGVILHLIAGVKDNVGSVILIGEIRCNITKLFKATAEGIYSAKLCGYLKGSDETRETVEVQFRINATIAGILEYEVISAKLLTDLNYVAKHIEIEPIKTNKCSTCCNNPRYHGTNTLILMMSYMIIGQIWFQCVEGWNFVDTFYFTVETASTVGYGDQAALQHVASYWFCLFFITAGIVIVFSSVGYLISTMKAKVESKVSSAGKKLHEQLHKSNQGEEEDSTTLVDKIKELPWPLVLMIIIGMIVFMSAELVSTGDGAKKLAFDEALYFTVVTFTTVGYGDIVAVNDEGKIFTSLWICFGVSSFAKFVGDMITKITQRREREKRNRIRANAFRREEDFLIFDKDNDGQITKAEFVLKMLEKLDLVPIDDLKEIEKLFHEIDTDHDDYLIIDEIKEHFGYQG